MRGYPFDRLPRLSRAEVDALRHRARAAPLASLVRGARGASAWLGAAVRLEVGPPRPAPPPIEPALAVLLEDAAGARAAVLFEPVIALHLIDLTLGGGGEEPTTAPLHDLEQGVLAYTIARWLAEAGSRFAVAAVLSSGAALTEALGAHEGYARWPLTLHAGPASGNAALVMREGPPDPPGRVPDWARALPVELAVTMATAALPAREVAALEPGDVVIPDGCALRLEEGALTGRVRIAQTRGRGAWIATLRASADEGTLEIVEVELRAPTSAAEVMVKDSDPSLDRMADTPVTLVVELARVTLPLSELAALAPGEVLRAGTPVGAQIALRAGDRVIAEGELVDVEGELGVRITRTADG